MNVFRIKLSANIDRCTWTWLLGLTVFVMISWTRADSADAGKFARLTEKLTDIDNQMAPMESLPKFIRGKTIYQNQCATCHGENGEGVAEEYDEPLYGNRSLESLTRRIVRTMPEDDPDLCVDEDAVAVSAYVFHSFYSAEARHNMGMAPRIELARLTVPQYQNSVADLLGYLTPSMEVKGPREPSLEASGSGEAGLNAVYFQSKGMNKANKQKLERIDTHIEFDFKEGSPHSDIEPDQFAIIWEGALHAEVTGHYEFRVSTQNGARLYLNNDPGRARGKLRDDSSVPGQQALIDGWVSSGEMRAMEARLFLLGGRHYPVRLEYFKYLEKTGSIKLEWKPPHGIWQVLNSEVLKTNRPPRTFVVETIFPADDRSLGYERGSSVSWSWFEAVTQAAVKTSSEIVERLPLLAGYKAGDENRASKLKEFLPNLAQLAYRRPLTGGEDLLFRDELLAKAESPEIAVRRGVMLALTSPSFLYAPWNASDSSPDSYQLASRLALFLWDSMPDRELMDAAAKNQLNSREQVLAQVQRMLHHPASKRKMRCFFEHWLEIEERDLQKDSELYPDFDKKLIVDLRKSLNLFIEEVVWSDQSDYRQLLLDDHLILNPFLKEYYISQEISEKAKEPEKNKPVTGFQRVRFPREQRSGILTHPYLLSAFAYHNNTSPIHRGVFLTRNIVGRALNPPPVAVAFKDSDFPEGITMREKVTQLTSDTACMACHSVINPLGFALENFDAVGRWRTHEKEKPVNTLSEYFTEEGERIEVERARDIAEFAAGNEAAHTAFVSQIFQYYVKHPPAAFAPNALRSLRLQFTEGEFNIQKLVMEMAVLAATFDLETGTQH